MGIDRAVLTAVDGQVVALGRKNYLFMGSASGGKAAAIAYTLIETARPNHVDPQAWLAQVLERLPDYKINRIDELLRETAFRAKIGSQRLI